MIRHLRERIALYFANFISNLLPQTRGFGLRRSLYSLAGIELGSDTKICGGGRIHYSNVEVGDATWIGWGAHFIASASARVSIGARCDVGPGVMFVVGTHGEGNQDRRAGRGHSQAITIGNGTWIGARCTFIAGASVGRGCVVAAGSTVTKQFGDGVLVGGVPAKMIRVLD